MMNLKQAMYQSRLPVLLVYCMIFATRCGRGVYFVTILWLALQISGDVASVGIVLIWWPVISLTVGPFMGVVVDRFNRRNLFALGESLRVAAVIGLVLKASLDSMDHIGMATLYLTAIIVSFGNLLCTPATQGLLQAVGGNSLTRTVAVGASAHQAGNVLGAMLGGLVIAYLGIEISFTIVALCSIAAMCFAIPLKEKGELPPARQATPYFIAVSDGFLITLRDQRLLIACLAMALLWSAAQLSGVLLAAFTRFELGLGADAYGWIDAMWGIGAILGSIVLAWLAQPLAERYLLRLGLLLMAAAIAGFSIAQGLWSALLFHGLMGVAFAVNRVVYDAYILKTVDSRMVGRVRSNIQAMIGAVGIITYLSPSLYAGQSVRTIYVTFAGLLAVAAVALLIWRYRLDRAERSRCATVENPLDYGLPDPQVGAEKNRHQHAGVIGPNAVKPGTSA